MSKILLVFALLVSAVQTRAEGWVRINQLGYLPGATKVAVYMGADAPDEFTLLDAYTGAAPYFYVTDQLGSVRAVVDGQGSIVERNDYYTDGNNYGINKENRLYLISHDDSFSGAESETLISVISK